MNVLQGLEAMDKLFDVPERWTKFAAAKGINGDFEGTGSETAACWCLVGAADRIEIINKSPIYSGLLRALQDALPMPHKSVVDYNDSLTTSFSDIKNLIHRAKERIINNSV